MSLRPVTADSLTLRLTAAPSDRSLPRLAMDRDWQIQPRLWGHALHPMCSYLGTFPAAMAHAFIARYSRPGDVVVDPFCGRGTVPLQAAAEGRIGVGLDRNPLARLLTGAKIDAPRATDVMHRLAELRAEHSQASATWSRLARSATRAVTDGGLDDAPRAVVPSPLGSARVLEPLPPLVGDLFHELTLGQLLFLRTRLDPAGSTDRFLLAAAAGILHGRSRSYLSTAMPNSFSPAPGYTRDWTRSRRHDPPDRDAFVLLAEKLRRLWRDGRPRAAGLFVDGDARDAGPRIRAALRGRGLPERARLVVTSPPYLRLIRYGSANWLRLWWLGEDPAEVDRLTDPPPDLRGYDRLMAEVLGSLREVLTDDAVVVMVLGDVATQYGRPRRSPADLASRVWASAAEPAGYRLAGVVDDVVPSGRKLTRLWGAEAGQGTTTDRLLVLGSTEAGRRRALAGASTPVDWEQRPERRRRPAILAAHAADVPPGRPGGDGPAGPDEESRPRPDDQPTPVVHPAATAAPLRA